MLRRLTVQDEIVERQECDTSNKSQYQETTAQNRRQNMKEKRKDQHMAAKDKRKGSCKSTETACITSESEDKPLNV